MNTYRRYRLPSGVLLVSLIILASGCSGPQLKITDLKANSHTDTSINYTVEVSNKETRTDLLTSLFCNHKEADALTWWQAYLSASDSPTETDKIPAGDLVISSQWSANIRDSIAKNETVSDTWNANAAVDTFRYPYLQLHLKSRESPDGDALNNNYCTSWNGIRSVPICNFSPTASGGQCNAKFNRNSINTATWNQYKPVECQPVSAPLFADAGPHDVFEFELQANFNVINDPTISVANKQQARSSGTLRYVDSNAQTVSIPIQLEARGNSRFSHCEYRPLKIVFANHQVGNIFQGASKKVKVVTHCGNHATSPWILGGTPEEQRRRLLSEYYFYQVQETHDTTALATRLARITYKNPDGTVLLTEYAFLREREDDACVRCGFVDEADDLDTLTPNQTSVFQGTLINKFLYNNDYQIPGTHNIRRCKDSSMNGYYIPYDWDLTGVIRPEYSKNGNINYTDNAQTLWSWLNSQTPNARTKTQAWYIASHDQAMRNVLKNSLLDDEGKSLMQGWYQLYMCTLQCYLGAY